MSAHARTQWAGAAAARLAVPAFSGGLVGLMNRTLLPMVGRALVLMLALAPAARAASADCPWPEPAPAGQSATAALGSVQARWTTEPATVQVGEPFVMVVSLCPANAQLVGVDATMPDHRHGMNYQPTFKPAGAGQWRVEGMVWHMVGRWELRLDTTLAGAPHRITQSVMLK